MVTTIQLRDDVKEALNKMKKNNRESYEDIIVRMMQIIEKHKREEIELLIEGCKEMAEENLRITKEWSATDNQLDWVY